MSAAFGRPDDESSFYVRWRLADGAEFREWCGYVVWEDFGSRFRLVIEPDGEVSCRQDP